MEDSGVRRSHHFGQVNDDENDLAQIMADPMEFRQLAGGAATVTHHLLVLRSPNLKFEFKLSFDSGMSGEDFPLPTRKSRAFC